MFPIVNGLMYVRGAAKYDAYPWCSHLYCFDLRANSSAISPATRMGWGGNGRRTSDGPASDRLHVSVYDIRGRAVRVVRAHGDGQSAGVVIAVPKGTTTGELRAFSPAR
jgi:hypothetical protein